MRSDTRDARILNRLQASPERRVTVWWTKFKSLGTGSSRLRGERRSVPRVNLNYCESIKISRSAEELYDLIADVTRTGEWSPICKSCWWDDGDGPRVGAWFTGRNETPERTWETRCEVVAAERGREFAFVVGGSWVRWSFVFTRGDQETEVTESWEFLPGGIARFSERYGAEAPAQIAERTQAAHQGIPATLAAVKGIAELT